MRSFAEFWNVSQAVFSDLLNVPKTIAISWERDLHSPSGAALRLLQIAKNQLKALMEIAVRPSPHPVPPAALRRPGPITASSCSAFPMELHLRVRQTLAEQRNEVENHNPFVRLRGLTLTMDLAGNHPIGFR